MMSFLHLPLSIPRPLSNDRTLSTSKYTGNRTFDIRCWRKRRSRPIGSADRSYGTGVRMCSCKRRPGRMRRSSTTAIFVSYTLSLRSFLFSQVIVLHLPISPKNTTWTRALGFFYQKVNNRVKYVSNRTILARKRYFSSPLLTYSNNTLFDGLFTATLPSSSSKICISGRYCSG